MQPQNSRSYRQRNARPVDLSLQANLTAVEEHILPIRIHNVDRTRRFGLYSDTSLGLFCI